MPTNHLGVWGHHVNTVNTTSLAEELRDIAARANALLSNERGVSEDDPQERAKADEILSKIVARAREAAQNRFRALIVMDIPESAILKDQWMYKRSFMATLDEEVAMHETFPIDIFTGAVRMVAEELLNPQYGFRLSIHRETSKTDVQHW